MDIPDFVDVVRCAKLQLGDLILQRTPGLLLFDVLLHRLLESTEQVREPRSGPQSSGPQSSGLKRHA